MSYQRTVRRMPLGGGVALAEWLVAVLVVAFGGLGVSATTLLLRRPIISAEPMTARWYYRFRDGSEKTGVSVFATMYLTNKGNVGTDVVGYFTMPGTCFGRF